MRLILFSILCVACDGGSGGGNVSPDQLPAELADVTCSKLAACCTAEELMDEALGASDETECRGIFTGFVGILSNVIEDSIAAGRMIYHGDRMADCLAFFRGLSCTEFQENNAGPFPNGQCEDPFEGLVELGGECANDFDCTSEYCSGDALDFDGNITFGTCIDPPLDGDPCDDGDCADGAFCDQTATAPICVDVQPDGSPCTADDECASDSCNDAGGSGTCGPPLTCNGI